MTVIVEKSDSYPYVFIKGDVSKRSKRLMDKEFSYYVSGYERSNEYKQGNWDGRETLLYMTSDGNYFVPIGLFSRLEKIFEFTGEEYEVVDPTPKVVFGDLDLEWKTNIVLRDYQQESISSVLINKGGLVCLPTGAGKTVVGIGAMIGFSTPTIIIVHKKDLLYQWAENIKLHTGYDVGLVGDGKQEFKDITVAMMQTLGQLIKKGKIKALNYTMIIFDECHRCPAATCYLIAMRCNAPIRLGLSATPRRADGADLKIWACVGDISKEITPVELVDRGFLAKPNFFFLQPPPNFASSAGKWHQVYVDAIVANEGRNELIRKTAEELMRKNHKVYIHVERIDHGEILQGLIEGSVFISGSDNMTVRNDAIDKFKKGEVCCLISTLLSEGSDIPEMTAIIMAGGMKSVVSTIQKIGRALRATASKKEAVIVDFKDKGKYVMNHWVERYNSYVEYYGKYVPKP